jgi:hypothetical protein
MAVRPTRATPLPHSWRIADWPTNVYPNSPGSGRYVVRTNRDELLALGALTRVGRDLIVIGESFARFLARKIGSVADYVPPGIAPPAPVRGAPRRPRRSRTAATA